MHVNGTNLEKKRTKKGVKKFFLNFSFFFYVLDGHQIKHERKISLNIYYKIFFIFQVVQDW